MHLKGFYMLTILLTYGYGYYLNNLFEVALNLTSTLQ